MEMADKMVSTADNKHVESMAFICGYRDKDGLHGTHMVFPVQEGNSSRVDDCGRLIAACSD